MKTLFLTFILGASIATANAYVQPHLDNSTQSARMVGEKIAPIDQKTKMFMEKINFHHSKVNMLLKQYEQSIAAVRAEAGGTNDLHAEMEKLIQFNYDEKGNLLPGSENAITEIRAKYGKKIQQQEKVEAKKIAKLKSFLDKELEKEQRAFGLTKKAYADQINVHTEGLIQALESQFKQASAK